jgi:hypothetical protein
VDEDLFDRELEEPRDLVRERQARIVLFDLQRVDCLTAYADFLG